jgi:predicted tellurium resistance membrane protein TerC
MPTVVLPTLNQIAALVSVVLIDLVLAGDNVIDVTLDAAGLPAEQRRRAIVIGIGAASVLGIVLCWV